MKWPIVEDIWRGSSRIRKTEYITKNTEIILDGETCKLCRNCVKVCPKDALSMPVLKKGRKYAKKDRIPIFSAQNSCVFCGICMSLCPYNAISFRENNIRLKSSDLPLVKNKKLPKFEIIKTGKVKLEDPNFQSNLWNKITHKSSLKIIE